MGRHESLEGLAVSAPGPADQVDGPFHPARRQQGQGLERVVGDGEGAAQVIAGAQRDDAKPAAAEVRSQAVDDLMRRAVPTGRRASAAAGEAPLRSLSRYFAAGPRSSAG